MSRGKRKAASHAQPAVPPVRRMPVVRPDGEASDTAPVSTADAATPRRAPLARKRRSRFVF